MAFNADDFIAALTPPAFTAGGVTYKGRLLSVPEYLELNARIQAMQGDRVDYDQAIDEACRVVAQIFPRRWYQLRSPAVRAFRKLPFTAQLAAIRDFLESLARAMPRVDAPLGTAASASSPSAT